MILYSLFIDDLRHADDRFDLVARTSRQAIQYMEQYGCPMFVSFDHDLGGEDTARAVVLWMLDRDMDSNQEFIPQDFKFQVHSANPIGAEWIRETLNSYLLLKARGFFKE